MTLGTKLSKLRKTKGVSLDHLAFELDNSKTAILKWEADKAKPSVDNLLKLCNYYQTDIYELLEDVSNVNFSAAKFKGNSYVVYPNNSTINFSNSPEIIENLQGNQKKITELIAQQNTLIIKLIDK
jgi:transcriptional regulator with XRE-family HTH domain